jgi:hypothetical protein
MISLHSTLKTELNALDLMPFPLFSGLILMCCENQVSSLIATKPCGEYEYFQF